MAPGWNLERAVAELRQLHAGGELMTYSNLRENGYGYLISAIERHVGTFARALALAGVPPARPRWDRERVVTELRRLHGAGVAMNSEELEKAGHASLVHAARKHFRSWRGALAKVGVPVYKRGEWKSWDAIARRLHELHASGTKMSATALRDAGHGTLFDAARAAAGTWNRALAKAGIPLVMARRTWTRDEVLDGIRKLSARGVMLSYNVAIARGHGKLVKAAARHFGTWQSACAAAVPGYVPLVVSWTEELVLRGIRERHRRGRSVRSTEVQREEPGLVMAARRLGLAWRDACRRAGVPRRAYAPRPPPPKRKRWTEEDILGRLKAAAAKGTPLVVRSFPSLVYQAAMRRFGTWPGAMAAAGLSRQYDRDRRRAVANRLGGAPLT